MSDELAKKHAELINQRKAESAKSTEMKETINRTLDSKIMG